MHQELDYKGLSKYSMLLLLPALVIASWITTAIIVGLTMMTAMALSAGLFGFFGLAGVAAQAGTVMLVACIAVPTIGVIGGLAGIYGAKDTVIRFFKAEPMPEPNWATYIASRFAHDIGLPRPQVYVYPSEDINAWATGSSPKDAAIGLSLGALQKLTRQELAAVIAHEMGHIAAGDIRRMQFAIGFQNALCWFAMFRGLKRMVRHTVAIVSELAVKALSRHREYWADAVGAALTSPAAMQQALQRVHSEPAPAPSGQKHFNELMLRWKNGGVLFATHPTLDQRINALSGRSFYQAVVRKLTGGKLREFKTESPFFWSLETGVPCPPSLRRPTPTVHRDWEALQSSLWGACAAIGIAVFAWLNMSAMNWLGGSHSVVGPQVAGWSQAAPQARPARAETVDDVIRQLALPDPMRVAGLSIPPPAPPRPVATPQQRVAIAPPPKPRVKIAECFTTTLKSLPAGIKFQQDFELGVYTAAKVTKEHEQALRAFPARIRSCIGNLGARYTAEHMNVGQGKGFPVEIWYYEPENKQCWIEAAPHKLGKDGLQIYGSCTDAH